MLPRTAPKKPKTPVTISAESSKQLPQNSRQPLPLPVFAAEVGIFPPFCSFSKKLLCC
ncbi:MAG TPA: hypothetical protein VNB22_07740 [Pyrinomonadaceae bacterium]|nr:hypothetical protein [Pyrinomonadaceae bacterium]